MKPKKKNVRSPKDAVINVKCTSGQKAALEAAAAHEGLGLSTWLLQAGILKADGLTGDETRRSRSR